MSEVIQTKQGPVQIAREGEGQPVLVVHGSPGGCDQGLVLGQFLVDAGFEVIAPSRPGYLGTPLAGRESIDQQADLHTSLLDTLNIDKLPVVCWSGGGPSSYRLAAKHPDRVSALVVFSGVSQAYKMHEENFSEKLVLSTAAGNLLMRGMANYTPKSTVKSALKGEGNLTKAELKRFTAEVMDNPNQLHFIQALIATLSYRKNRRAGFENDKEQYAAIKDLELEKIKAPALIVHGNVDTDVPFENGLNASKSLPKATFIEVDKGTHLAAFAHPEASKIQQQAIEIIKQTN